MREKKEDEKITVIYTILGCLDWRQENKGL